MGGGFERRWLSKPRRDITRHGWCVGLRKAACTAMVGLGACLFTCSTAFGAGLYIADRGVRPLGRGGAFVAGADDLGAIFYNPAGLVDAKRQVLFDVAVVPYTTSYTRVAKLKQVDPNTGRLTGQTWDRRFPTVDGTSPLLPIPTLAVSYDFGLDNAAFALGLWAPYAAVADYPATVKGQPNPGRYMLISLKGSAFVIPGIWGAYRVLPWLSVGAGFELLSGKYTSQGVMSACLPDRWVCAPEDPEYDSFNRMDVGPVIAPSGNFGLTLTPHPRVRIGASFQLPFHVNAKSVSESRIPSAAVFQNAYPEGDRADVIMSFPWVARAGVQVDFDPVRAEFAVVTEGWSVHDEIKLIPHGIVLRNVFTLADDYRIMPQTIPRHFKDTWSFRLGGEMSLDVGGYALDVRAGIMYETSAVPKPYMSLLTIDANKVIPSIGAGFHLMEGLRFDAVLARTFLPKVRVSSDEAKIQMPSSVLANESDPEMRDYVNGGLYKATATIIGLGLAYDY